MHTNAAEMRSKRVYIYIPWHRWSVTSIYCYIARGGEGAPVFRANPRELTLITRKILNQRRRRLLNTYLSLLEFRDDVIYLVYIYIRLMRIRCGYMLVGLPHIRATFYISIATRGVIYIAIYCSLGYLVLRGCVERTLFRRAPQSVNVLFSEKIRPSFFLYIRRGFVDPDFGRKDAKLSGVRWIGLRKKGCLFWCHFFVYNFLIFLKANLSSEILILCINYLNNKNSSIIPYFVWSIIISLYITISKPSSNFQPITHLITFQQPKIYNIPRSHAVKIKTWL